MSEEKNNVVFLGYFDEYDIQVSPDVEASDSLKRRVLSVIGTMQHLIKERPNIVQPIKARATHDGVEYIISFGSS